VSEQQSSIPPPRAVWWQAASPIAADSALPAAAEIVVAGGGLTGISAALLLARQGRRVVVVEAREVGAGTTGNTTAKLSLLQGDVLSELRRHAGDAAVRAYVTANRTGQEWLVGEVSGVPAVIRRATAYTFATTGDGAEAIEREGETLRMAGLDHDVLPSGDGSRIGLPFPITGALAMADQHLLQPLLALRRLAERFREAGGRIVQGCRVVGAQQHENGLRVETDRGGIDCTTLVLATGTPILDRGLFFAKLEPLRSLVGAYAVDDERDLPDGAYLSVDPVSRSLRTARDEAGRTVLLVGSESFTPGRGGSVAGRLSALDEWTRDRYPGARRTTWWAAQDYRATSRVPYAGPLPRGGGRIFAATAYNKWGMTNAVAAALAIAGSIAGDRPAWARELEAARPFAGGETVAANAKVAGELVAGWVRAESAEADPGPTREGAGRVGRSGLQPIAESTVDGVTCRVSGVCTHLGGILAWNDAERSWDCPLHGSRFDAQGRVIEGPAVRDLDRIT
jgi:glycine/D-amino acid oxidase-like deaminating enzyme